MGGSKPEQRRKWKKLIRKAEWAVTVTANVHYWQVSVPLAISQEGTEAGRDDKSRIGFVMDTSCHYGKI